MCFGRFVPNMQRLKISKSWLHHVCVSIVLSLTGFEDKFGYYPNAQYFDKHSVAAETPRDNLSHGCYSFSRILCIFIASYRRPAYWFESSDSLKL